MKSSTVVPVHEGGTGSSTIADLIGLAAERHARTPALRYKRDGEWRDLGYAELGEIVSEVGRGLIDLGVQPGDRVAILCTTRPEWTFAHFAIVAAGAIAVPIYPTNSPEECRWVAGNSEARMIVCEDAAQLAKIRAVREDLPALETLIVVDPSGIPDAASADGEGEADDAIALDAVRERGRDRDAAELAARTQAVTREQPYTIIYTSGTTGPPKGCVLSHGNYRDVVTMCEHDEVVRAGDVAYLFLPLAHSFALLIQLTILDLGGTLAYFSGDPKQIIPELSEIRPNYLPSVPRIFEKLYTLVTAHGDAEQIKAATQVGLKVRHLRAAGQEVPAELQAHFDAAEETLFKNVRAAFGGNLRQATSGAAPIATGILEFFFACGVPVLEGFGMTETATASTVSTVDDYRFGSVGRALPGLQIRIADDGEVLLKGPNIFQGYYKNDDASFGAIVDGWLHTGRPRLARRGRVPVHHRPQEGHHHHRGRQEPHAGQPGERPQAVALDLPGRHARRPPAVPGRPDHARPGGDRPLRSRARPPRGPRVAVAGAEGDRARPGRARRRQRQVRAGREDQAVLHPRPRPLPGDRRADPDAQGQAERGQRAVRPPARRALRGLRRC
jgi:long-chain acyl-CoA synthetase